MAFVFTTETIFGSKQNSRNEQKTKIQWPSHAKFSDDSCLHSRMFIGVTDGELAGEEIKTAARCPFACSEITMSLISMRCSGRRSLERDARCLGVDV